MRSYLVLGFSCKFIYLKTDYSACHERLHTTLGWIECTYLVVTAHRRKIEGDAVVEPGTKQVN